VRFKLMRRSKSRERSLDASRIMMHVEFPTPIARLESGMSALARCSRIPTAQASSHDQSSAAAVSIQATHPGIPPLVFFPRQFESHPRRADAQKFFRAEGVAL